MIAINHHTALLNYLAKTNNLNHYLEIGVQNKNNNFNKIICRNKFGVDPDPNSCADFIRTSDEFFNNMSPYKPLFDLVFIDGYHSAEQVKKDFDNSFNVLMPHGFIVIHDCIPKIEATTIVPRETKIWHGDVYKFVLQLHTYPGIDFITYPFDEGCCVVWKDETKPGSEELIKPSWQTYLSHRHLMNTAIENIIEIPA